MAKPALGTKRICSGCAAKFYDLGKDPIVCPTCDTVFVVPKPTPPRGGRSYAPRVAYDPKAQSEARVGVLKEAEAVVGDAGETEDVGTERVEADGTEEPGGVPMLEEFDEK